MEQGSTSVFTSTSHGNGNHVLQPKYKVFLSHSGAQKGFVEQLCVDLERCDRHPFLDKRRDCLPIGKAFPRLIFEAIEECEVGVVVLSEEFFTSKWPMLELVAMANVKKRKPSFTIMPIFLGITFPQCRNPKKHEEWLSLWQTWAEKDSRIDVKDWEGTLQLFGPTNALKYNLEVGEVKFREEIVEAICALVPPRTRFEDSHIQGKSRLCKVILETIEGSKLSSLYEVHIVGIYGIGGIGKTTICKAICNYLLEEYRYKVAHIELGSRSDKEILKEVLGKFTDKNLDVLGEMDVAQYRYHLMRDMMNAKVFLTIDNVSSATTNQALTLLRASYGCGSVVLVTARSLNELTALRIDASACIEMPELEMEEARSLFLYHASCVPSTYLSNKDDHELISSCVERCYFKKGDDISHHYHPLALQVLGEQFGCVGYVRERWWSLLHELDFLNPFGEVHHPVFSILRRSFDVLNPKDQLLFMDAALFAPDHRQGLFKFNIFEWLGMVHGIPLKSVIEQLENLKRKSILENLGDGFGRIGMHDLWREFARLETKAVEFEKRRWIYEYNTLEEGSLTNGGNVRRMYFLDEGFMKLEDVNFACFPDVRILKLVHDFGSVEQLDLDLRGLKHLKSLELKCGPREPKKLQTLIGLGSLLKLGFLRWSYFPSNSPCIDEIGCLTNLRMLDLRKCDRLPDLSSLVFLQVAGFRESASVTLTGLSSKHTNLQFLDLSFCEKLQSCPSVGKLVALQELHLYRCSKLKKLPNLQKLERLQKLDLSFCYLVRGLPGLGDLVNLRELHARCCFSLADLPYMHNLQNLRILDLSNCKRIKSSSCLDELDCLQSLRFDSSLNVSKLTNLQTLELDQKAPLQSLLRCLDIGRDEVHDWHKLTGQERLLISEWQGQEFSSLTELVSLESFTLNNCKGMYVLPDLERLSRLHDLKFGSCEFEDLSGLIKLTSLEVLEITRCNNLKVLPDLRELAKLRELWVMDCEQLRDVLGILGLQSLEIPSVSGHLRLHEHLGHDLHRLTGLRDLNVADGRFVDLQGLAAFSQLGILICQGCPIQEFPDLANFPKLCVLDVRDCVNLLKLVCTGPISPKFIYLDVHGCKNLQALPDLTNARKMNALGVYGCQSLQALPDLTNSWKMQWLDVSNSGVLLSAKLIQDMKVRWPSIDLITQDTSSQVRRQGSSHGIWHHYLGMIASLHCGYFRTSSSPN